MELRHLRSLVMVADEAHFTRAARRLQIAQPALSQQIRRLEADVGLALVERTTRSVRLTQAGQVLVEHARRVLSELETAGAELDELRGVRAGRLAVGASQTMLSLDLSALLAAFHRRFPAVELAVEEDISLALAGALNRDELDVGFLTLEAEGLESHPVATERLVCIVPADHRIAALPAVDLRALEHERFIVFRRGATIRQSIDKASQASGFSPAVLFETNNTSRMTSLVAQGLGIAVLPESDAARTGAGVAVVPLSTPGLRHTIYLSWRAQRRHSPAARAFVDLVHRSMRREDADPS
jgi:DNA-binding transcriptional LysR family regulator